jgi:hypothetical protein
MGSANSRGQCAAELLVVLLLLTTIVLTYIQYSEIGARLFHNVQLSKEEP